jgi:hypothetical protein
MSLGFALSFQLLKSRSSVLIAASSLAIVGFVLLVALSEASAFHGDAQ